MYMDKNELKKLLCEAVDSVKDQTKAFADDVAAHAERRGARGARIF